MKKLSMLALSLLSVFALASCSGGNDGEVDYGTGDASITESLKSSSTKIALASVGGAGIETVEGYFEDELGLVSTESEASNVAGSKYYEVEDFTTLTEDYVVFVVVEFTGKGNITIASQKTVAQELIDAETAKGFKVVLVGTDGAKNRGASTDALWDLLTPIADTVVVAKGQVNYDSKFVSSSTYTLIEAGGQGTENYNACVNSVVKAYNDLAK